MPKAILEFNLPEEREEYEMAVKGVDYHIALSDFDNHLRAIVKYGDSEYTDEQQAFAQVLRDKLWEIMNDRELK